MAAKRDCVAKQEIYEALDFFLRRTPKGLLPFLSEKYTLLSSKELFDLLGESKKVDENDTRVDGGKFTPLAERVLERCDPYLGVVDRFGGLELFREAFQEYGDYTPYGKHDLDILRTWSQWGAAKYRTIEAVAEACGYGDTSGLYKRKHIILMDLSEIVYSLWLLAPGIKGAKTFSRKTTLLFFHSK